MGRRHRALLGSGAPLVAGVLFVAVPGGIVRPRQNDLAHTIGVLTAGGGRALHAAHFTLGSDALGRYTVFVTASVAPPIRGDVRVALEGPAPVEYRVCSRYPPGVPLLNRLRPWYRFDGRVLRGIAPGDDLVVVVTLDPPSTPGDYAVTFSDARTRRPYLSVPVTFAQAASPAESLPPCCQ